MTPSPVRSGAFEALYAQPDPFGYRNRWYEARKRHIVLSTLPAERYDRGWEMGCSNGELTASLAERCAAMLATDISQRAVDLARERLRDHPHVVVERADHPVQWPDGTFDLVVFSEIGYYMEPDALVQTIERLQPMLAAGGLLVACHWLAPIADAPSDAETVHHTIDDVLDVPVQYRYVDRDFMLEAWGPGESIAIREGLR